MDTEARPATTTSAGLDPEREQYWRRRLGRIRLGVESIEVQRSRARRVTLVLTGVAGGIALMFVALFAGFGRPDVGVILVAVVLGPILGLAWLEDRRTGRRVAEYLREVDAARRGLG